MTDRGPNDDPGDAASRVNEPMDARSLAGAWADLDSEEAIEELDRLRHESKPTPPIDEL